MWISVVPGSACGPELVVPASVWPAEAPKRAELKYGAAARSVTVGTGQSAANHGAGPDDPVEIFVAPAVIAGLHMRTEPIYQLKATDGQIEIGPVLGLLLGNRTNWYNDAYLRREPERVATVSRETGGLFCAFSPRCFSPSAGCAYGLYYDPGQDRWVYGTLPLPATIHRRSFHTSGSQVARLEPVQIFNSRRFSKWELFQLLQSDPALSPHLPATVMVTEGTEVFDLLRRHPMIVLKPSDLSRGRGILFVEREGRRYRLLDCRTGGAPSASLLWKRELQALIEEELVGRRYLAQQRISLATVDGAPFDLRVVMQRGPDGDWTEQAMECRLAGAGNLVTNIAFGGRALWLNEAVADAFGGQVDPGDVEGKALETAVRMCRALDETGEHFAEWGLDLALDQTGRLWIIEANVIPTFKGFAALDPDLYRRLLAAPMRYAAHLSGFGGAPEEK